MAQVSFADAHECEIYPKIILVTVNAFRVMAYHCPKKGFVHSIYALLRRHFLLSTIAFLIITFIQTFIFIFLCSSQELKMYAHMHLYRGNPCSIKIYKLIIINVYVTLIIFGSVKHLSRLHAFIKLTPVCIKLKKMFSI